MRHVLRIAFGTLCVVYQAPAQTPLLWGHLTPGTYAVGFRLQYKLDHSREYDPEFATDTSRLAVHRPRPIVIGVWYPAQKTGASPMLYRQYLEISPGPGPLAAFGARLESATRDVVGEETTGKSAESMGPAEKAAFGRLLATRTFAVKNGPAAIGHFPVLIYHPGSGGTYEDNSAMFEYLASHGYVVVSSAFPDPDATSALITGDLAGSFADLDFLVNFARTVPNADADRLGVMGHSYGAWASFAWAAKPGSPLQALITLDSGFEYDSLGEGPVDLQAFMKKNRNNIHAATLRVASARRTPHFEFLDPFLRFVPRYEASTTSMTHNDYLTHGAIRPALMPGRWPDSTIVRRASYDRLSQVVLNFLDASLKQSAGAREFLGRELAGKGPDSRIALQFRAAEPRPPSQRQMALYLRQHGPEATMTMLRAFPDIAQSKLLGGMMALMGEDDVKTALPALRLAEKSYPRNAGIQAMLGQALAITGDSTAAGAAYRKAQALWPTDSTMGVFTTYWKNKIDNGLRELTSH